MCLVTQSYLTLCSSVDCSQHGSSVHGIFPARILEWIAIPYSRNSFWPRNWTRFLASRALAGRFLTTAAAKSLQSCRILCDPIDGSPWGSPVPGILQARALEWVAISFSNAWKRKAKVKSLFGRQTNQEDQILQGRRSVSYWKLHSDSWIWPQKEIVSSSGAFMKNVVKKPKQMLLLLLSRFSRVRLCATP